MLLDMITPRVNHAGMSTPKGDQPGTNAPIQGEEAEVQAALTGKATVLTDVLDFEFVEATRPQVLNLKLRNRLACS